LAIPLPAGQREFGVVPVPLLQDTFSLLDVTG
jgi:hypothetical protein